MKKTWNYLPLASMIFCVVVFILLLHFEVDNGMAYFILIFVPPIIASSIMVYLNFKTFDKKDAVAFCVWAAFLQLIVLLFGLSSCDSEGEGILLAYIGYIFVANVVLCVLQFAISCIVKQSEGIKKYVYFILDACLFVAFVISLFSILKIGE